MKIQTTTILMLALITPIWGCGAGDNGEEKEGEDDELVEESPDDTTGATGTVSLGFGTGTASLTLLEDVPVADPAAVPAVDPATIVVNETLTLSMARFNIAAIKVKAKKDQSEKEQEVEKAEGEDEKVAVAEVEAAGGGSADATAEKGDKPDAKPDAKPDGAPDAPKDPADKGLVKGKLDKAKLAGKKDELKKKHDEQAEKEHKRDKATKFKGPYVYDAVKGAIEGVAPAVDLVDGSYRRIEFKLKRNLDVAETDPLLGNSFVIRGTLKKGDVSVPVEVDCHVAMNFRLRGEGAFAVAAGTNKLALVFDVAKWFDGIDLSTATVDADGTIYLNRNTNQALLHELKKNIKKNTRFGKDKDGDGKLKDDEKAGQGEETVDAVD